MNYYSQEQENWLAQRTEELRQQGRNEEIQKRLPNVLLPEQESILFKYCEKYLSDKDFDFILNIYRIWRSKKESTLITCDSLVRLQNYYTSLSTNSTFSWDSLSKRTVP